MDHQRAILIVLNADLSIAREVVYKLAEFRQHWKAGALDSDAVAEAAVIPRRHLRQAQRRSRAAPERAREIEQAAVDRGLRVLVVTDSDYPDSLRRLSLPPPIFYVRGALPSGPAIAIVGSRRADAYGREVAELFASELARNGLVIVSGLARGIDAAAHAAAIAAGGRTVGVLGCGLDIDYPRGHASLKADMVKSGAVISEFPLGTSPLPRNFPIRNRVIVALSLGTLIVQGAPRSGTLVTARLSLEMNREIWAVPGRIFDKKAAGPNLLIRDGATPVLRPRDILEGLPMAVRDALNLLEVPPPPSPPVGPAGSLVQALPRGESWTAEQFGRSLSIPVSRILELLLQLELAGVLKRDVGATYRHAIGGNEWTLADRS